MRIGNRDFDLNNNTYIMGILNVTPDSFSDGGKWNDMDRAIAHAKEMIEQGADIIDIGGESTRPGYIKVTEDEEIERIVPYIQKVKELGVPVSVDTYKAKVARAALEAGADLINDIWGFKGDEDMAAVAAEYDVPCCLMHNRDLSVNPYKDFLQDMMSDLRECVDIAFKAGVKKENIILDPGVGFGKTLEQNLLVMKNLDEYNKLGFPMLLGTSRKSMIGLTLDLPVDERVEGTMVTSVMAAMSGYAFVRVHDIKENYRAIKMTKAIMNVK